MFRSAYPVSFKIFLAAGFAIMVMTCCKKPKGDENEHIVDTIPGYTTVVPDMNLWVLSMSDYKSFDHCYYDDYIYLITTGERYDIRKAKFAVNAHFYGNFPFYESEHKLNIRSAVRLEGGDSFLAVGGILNESPLPYSNPFYKANSPGLDIRIFNWEGRNNSFEGVTQYSGDYMGALFLARDEVGSVGSKYPLYEYSMVFTEHYDDSAYISPFPIDSCYIDYYDKPSVFTERFVGMKIDAVTQDTGIVTHMFYFENAGGYLVEYNLGNLFPGGLVGGIDPQYLLETIQPLLGFRKRKPQQIPGFGVIRILPDNWQQKRLRFRFFPSPQQVKRIRNNECGRMIHRISNTRRLYTILNDE